MPPRKINSGKTLDIGAARAISRANSIHFAETGGRVGVPIEPEEPVEDDIGETMLVKYFKDKNLVEEYGENNKKAVMKDIIEYATNKILKKCPDAFGTPEKHVQKVKKIWKAYLNRQRLEAGVSKTLQTMSREMETDTSKVDRALCDGLLSQMYEKLKKVGPRDTDAFPRPFMDFLRDAVDVYEGQLAKPQMEEMKFYRYIDQLLEFLRMHLLPLYNNVWEMMAKREMKSLTGRGKTNVMNAVEALQWSVYATRKQTAVIREGEAANSDDKGSGWVLPSYVAVFYQLPVIQDLVACVEIKDLNKIINRKNYLDHGAPREYTLKFASGDISAVVLYIYRTFEMCAFDWYMNTLYDLSADVYEVLNPKKKETDGDSDTDADDGDNKERGSTNKRKRKNQTRGLAQEKTSFKKYLKQKEDKQKSVSYYIAGYACHQALKRVRKKEGLLNTDSVDNTLALLREVCSAPKNNVVDEDHVESMPRKVPREVAELIEEREKRKDTLIRCADWLFSFMWELRVHVFDTHFGEANIRQALLGEEYIPYVKNLIRKGDIYRRLKETVAAKISEALESHHDAETCTKVAKSFVFALVRSYTNVGIKDYTLFLKKMLDKAKEKSADLRTSFRKEKDIRHKIKIEKSKKPKRKMENSSTTEDNPDNKKPRKSVPEKKSVHGKKAPGKKEIAVRKKKT